MNAVLVKGIETEQIDLEITFTGEIEGSTSTARLSFARDASSCSYS